MNFGGYSFKDSIIHHMNPALKFVVTIFIIAMIFIPYGFLYQVVLLILCLGLYFLARLPFKKLWRIFVSILVLALILALINWVTYKQPGVVFDFTDSKTFLGGLPSFLNDTNSIHITKAITDPNNPGQYQYFLQGDMYGGIVVSNSAGNAVASNFNSVNYIGNGFFSFDPQQETSANIINQIKDYLLQYYNSNGLSVKYTYAFSKTTGIYYAYFCLTHWYTYSLYALLLMTTVSLKIFLMILVVTILTSTTSSIQLTCALEDILNPLKFFRLPVNEWSMTIALVLRFIPSLLNESSRILNAQASRGLDFKNGTFFDKMFSLTSLVVPLFSIAFKKASELSNAMEARNYNPRHNRTRYRDYDVKIVDWFILALVAFLLGILIALVTLLSAKIYINFGFWNAFI